MEKERIACHPAARSGAAGPVRPVRTVPPQDPALEHAPLRVTIGSGHDGVTIVALAGELDVATAPQLARHFEALAGGRQTHLVVDLANLDFCDCAGLSVLLRAYRRCETDGGWLRLAAAKPMFTKILRITRLTRTLVCYPSVEYARDGPAKKSCDLRSGRPARQRTRVRPLDRTGRGHGVGSR